MSKQREVIDFSKPLPNDKITQVLGATLSCLGQSGNHDDFKKCLFGMSMEESMVPTEEKPSVAADFASTVADGVADAANAVSNAASNFSADMEKKKRTFAKRK